MKLYSQLSVNNILLEPAPFKMELVMEAFLVENPAVLSFDGDVIPEVLDYEIPLSNGRNNKNGRIDILAKYSDKLAAIIELKKGLIDIEAYNQLKDYLENKNNITDERVKNCKFIGVLVGTQIAKEVEDLLSNEKRNSNLPSAAIILNRYKNQQTNQFFITAEHYGRITERDTSTYWFNGDNYNKRNLILAIVKYIHLNEQKISFENLKNMFSDKLLNKTIKKFEEISESTRNKYFINDELKLFDGTKIVVCSDWGTDFDKVVDALRKIKRFMEDEENLSKSSQKIMKSHQEKRKEAEV